MPKLATSCPFFTLPFTCASPVYSAQVLKRHHLKESPPFTYFGRLCISEWTERELSLALAAMSTVIVCAEFLFEDMTQIWPKSSGPSAALFPNWKVSKSVPVTMIALNRFFPPCFLGFRLISPAPAIINCNRPRRSFFDLQRFLTAHYLKLHSFQICSACLACVALGRG